MSTTTGPSVSSILGSMTGVTVTNGWDVISAVSADALNDFLIGQFAYNMGQDLTLGPYSGEVQIINNSYVVFENLVLGSPLIQISAGLTNPNDVKLAIPFLGGTVSVVNYLGEVGDQKLVMVTSSQFISPGSGYTLTAVVPLINFQGVVAPGTDSGQVQINFAGGSGFSANVGVSGAAQTTLGAYLAELVAQDWTQSSYVLGTLIYDAGTNLVPVMFELATQISNLEGDTGRLLLFIATNYNPGGGSQELLTISNPIPEGYTTALIVSSQVLFENLIQPSIASQLNSYGVTVTASQQTAAQNLGAWQLTGGKSANVGPATVDVESADPTNIWTCDQSANEGCATESATDVQIPMSAFSMVPGGNSGVSLVASLPKTAWDQGYLNTTVSGKEGCVPYWNSMTMYASFTTMASPKVNPSTDVVSFNSSPSVSVTFDQPSWWEKIFVSAEYEQDIGDQIQAGAQSALNSLVDFQVPSVNTFAVANLLFPSLQIMSFQSANVPGDLIVFGALQNTSLSATPVYVTLTGGGTQQFEANQAVNWSIPKQGATTGSISQFGLYTAPSKVRKPLIVSIVATSQTSSQVTAFAVVSLVPDDVIVSPFIAILTSGQTQQFVASLVGDSNPAVTWSLSPAENTGILSGSGLYTAPSLGSSAPPVAVTVAANQQGGAAVGSALVCVFALAPSTAIAVTPAMTKTALGPNQTQQFSAQLIGSESEFTWSILPAGLGSINSSGLYKAPASISEPGSVVVVATSTITSVLFGTAVVLLN